MLSSVNSKTDVWQGTLALMVLKTLERAGALQGHGIARQIEKETEEWEQLASILARFLNPKMA